MNKKLSVTEKVGYGLGDTASNIVFQVVLNFMMYFYTDVFGIEAAAAGTLMLVVRLFDMVTDPVMGGLADRTRSRHGRYRPYLIWGAIPYCVLAVAAFSTPDVGDASKLLYAYLSYALLMTAYTVVNIPYSALGGVMSNDPGERAELQGFRFTLAMVGSFIVNSSLLLLVTQLGKGDDVVGFQYAMGVLSLVAFVCFIGCFFATKERALPEQTDSATPFREILVGIYADFIGLIKSNREWGIVAIVSFFIIIIAVLRGGITLYFTKYYLQCEPGQSIDLILLSYNLCDTSELGTAFFTIGTLGSLFGAVCTIFFSKKYCKTRIFYAAVIGFIFLSAGQYFVPSDQILSNLAFYIAINYCHIVMVALVFAMTADTVDWGHYVTGNRATAMTFSGHLFAIKLGAAVGGLVLGWLLAYYSYQAPIDGLEQLQSEDTQHGLLMVLTLFPAFLGVFIFVCFTFYRLTAVRLTEIQKELGL